MWRQAGLRVRALCWPVGVGTVRMFEMHDARLIAFTPSLRSSALTPAHPGLRSLACCSPRSFLPCCGHHTGHHMVEGSGRRWRQQCTLGLVRHRNWLPFCQSLCHHGRRDASWQVGHPQRTCKRECKEKTPPGTHNKDLRQQQQQTATPLASAAGKWVSERL